MEEKLKDKCIILRRIIINLSEIYRDENTNEDQEGFIETMIGAAIFYLSQWNWIFFTGKISEEARKLFKDGKPVRELTPEHEFPRKLAGKKLLTTATELDNLRKFESRLLEYGRWNLVTPSENNKLRKFQTEKQFVSPEDSYSRAGIKLVEEDPNLFKKSTKGPVEILDI